MILTELIVQSNTFMVADREITDSGLRDADTDTQRNGQIPYRLG